MADGIPATSPIWDEIIDRLKKAAEDHAALLAEIDRARGELGDLAQRVAALEQKAGR
jgi:hypothetical protein